MKSNWEASPMVHGVIDRAWIGVNGEPDVLHVQSVQFADGSPNLGWVSGRPGKSEPDRALVLVGKCGSIARHGYTHAVQLIGKRCLIRPGEYVDNVAIEAGEGDCRGVVGWCEYICFRAGTAAYMAFRLPVTR